MQATAPASFESLFTPLANSAFGVAVRYTGNRADAEDLVQEAVLLAFRGFDSFEPGTNFKAWFFRILTNRGLNMRQSRALRTVSEIPDDTASSDDSPELSAEREELRTRLRDAVATLPERQQLIVQLFEIDGWTSAEVAKALGISDGTVRWHVHEARRALRAALGPLRRQEQN